MSRVLGANVSPTTCALASAAEIAHGLRQRVAVEHRGEELEVQVGLYERGQFFKSHPRYGKARPTRTTGIDG